MISTRELIQELRSDRMIMAGDDAIGCKPPTDLELEAADNLERLMRYIDDITNDHYVDYLEWYQNRCDELQEELDALRGGTDVATHTRPREGIKDCCRTL